MLVGNQENIKFLGTPAYHLGTDEKCGKIISRETIKFLETWKCSQYIVSMTFDTTSSNTGHLSAACIEIQTVVGKTLIWAACPHHIGELILTRIFNDLKIEAPKSPEVSLFSRFKKYFEHLPHSSNMEISKISTEDHNQQATIFIQQCTEETIDLLGAKTNYSRDDYKEFGQLCLLYMGARENIAFKRPYTR